MKKVAVVILNWNGKDFLKKFLPSVLRSCATFNSVGRFESHVIVADNGSTDESKKIFKEVKEQFIESMSNKNPLYRKRGVSLIKWLQLQKNHGFALGYNNAIALIKEAEEFDYYILLNSDVYTPDGWLDSLINFMEYKPEVAACQPKILSWASYEKKTNNEKGVESFEYAGASGGYIDKWGFPFCRGRILSNVERDTRQYNTPLRTFWASGACLVIRREIWEKLNGFDGRFFAHMEEIDLCWRAALLGYEIWCNPQSKIYHVGGGTLPNNSPQKLFLNYRNSLLMLRKNIEPKYVFRKVFIRKLIDGLSALVYLFKGEFSFFTAVLKAHLSYNKMKRKFSSSPRDYKIYKQQHILQTHSNSKVKKRAFSGLYGVYYKSIVLSYLKGKKRFDDLRFY